jgi:hypothetical protein
MSPSLTSKETLEKSAEPVPSSRRTAASERLQLAERLTLEEELTGQGSVYALRSLTERRGGDMLAWKIAVECESKRRSSLTITLPFGKICF